MSKARQLADLLDNSGDVRSENLGNEISLDDNVKAKFGASDDLQIYHDGSHSIISDSGTGDLLLRGGSNVKIQNAVGGQTMITAQVNNKVGLSYNGVEKLATTSTGVDVTGTVTADGLDLGDNSVLNVDTIALDKIKGDADDNTNITFAGSDHTRFYQGGDNVFTVNPDGIEVTAKTTTNELDLTAIAQSKSDSAVDVFVYDTSKDSDGGAWRKRTQHTSWYNETLNTSTRGSRKEFPAVAVIVLETNSVTIYDGDDPSLPMWMVISSANSGATWNGDITTSDFDMLSTNGNAVAMQNGILSHAGASAFTTISFVDERSVYRAVSTNTDGVYSGGIAERDSNKGHRAESDLGFIVGVPANDVAMTVLPNAPIDPDTGLPVPTIAVATDGGVSVIKDDGTVVDIGIWNSNAESNDVGFTADNKIMLHNSWAVGIDSRIYIYDIPTTDVGATDYAEIYSGTDFFNGVHASFDSRSANEVIAYQEESLAVAVDYSLKHLLLAERHSDLKANITSDYNTGWMNGDIKLATLSDTDDTDVVGSELVTNGDFASGTSNWTVGGTGASGTVTSGQYVLTRNGTSATLYQDISGLIDGKSYIVTADFVAATGGAYVRVDFEGATTPSINTTGQITLQATASGTTGRIMFNTMNTASGSITIDNVSVRLAEEDRSVNGNGLQVHGTIQKNPVATGADLVAYTSNSASNYLLQPYNSDLEFGTGDFCFMFWDDGTSGSYRGLVTFGDRGISSSDGHGVRSGPTGNVYQFWANSTAQSSITGAVGSWNHITFVRRNGVLHGYLNGNLFDTDSFDHDLNTLTNPEMSIFYGDVVKSTTISMGVWTGNAALLRISATAPTAEQIAKIYEDEKVLFQDGAQATLYGSSDAVTALAYDDSTELLHVGTSAGRSVFQGLRRVDNTTDAVGSCISAANGLVAED